MSGKFRIDFSIRELDVPEESARGVRFGDDVSIRDIPDFFNKCRDAVRSLFIEKSKTHEELQAEINRLIKERDEAKRRHQQDMLAVQENIQKYIKDRDVRFVMPSAPSNPYAGRSKSELDHMDDGSRGGDGPSDPRYIEAYRAANRPDRDRY